MPITNLQAMFRHNGTANQPVLICLHGWDGQMLSGDPADAYYLDRIRSYGIFAVSVGMRGRFGASGSRDVSGREIHDIYDALLFVRANFPQYVSPTKAALMGVSGGGGNVLAAACKFPDTWNCIADFYGMSDYGRDATHSWYVNNNYDGYELDMRNGIGGSPAQVPDAYWSRDATYAISNYSGGILHLFHDDDDTTVYSIHSQRIVTAMAGAGLSNYSTHYTNSGSPVRYTHGHSLSSAAALASEAIYLPDVLTQSNWTIAASGSLKVIGYIVTKRFSIYLSDMVSDVVDVAYDTAAGQYTVTPRTGSVAVSIRQGAQAAEQTISSPTLMQVA